MIDKTLTVESHSMVPLHRRSFLSRYRVWDKVPEGSTLILPAFETFVFYSIMHMRQQQPGFLFSM